MSVTDGWLPALPNCVWGGKMLWSQSRQTNRSEVTLSRSWESSNFKQTLTWKAKCLIKCNFSAIWKKFLSITAAPAEVTALEGRRSNRVKQLQELWSKWGECGAWGRLPLEVEDFEAETIFSSSSFSRMCVQCTSARISKGSTGFTICCSLRFPASRRRAWRNRL